MTRRLLPVLLFATLAGCWSSEPTTPAVDYSPERPRKVTLQLNWYPETEHGGFYAALLNGYYKEEGLDVEILPGGADTPVLQQVASGKADFGVENADRVLLMRAQEADVVAVLAPMQTSPRCLVVHESSGAASFGDLAGQTLAMNAGEPFAQFLLAGPLPKGIEVVPYTGGVTFFLRDEKHAQQGYVFSEPLLAAERGGDPKTLLVADAGFNPYTSCLVTRGGTADKDAELVRRMVAASVRGWKEYLTNPTPANAEIHRLNPEMDFDLLADAATAMRPLCVPAGEEKQPFGRLTADRWTTLAKQMTDVGVLKTAGDPAKAFRGEFVPTEPAGLTFPKDAQPARTKPAEPMMPEMIGEE